MSTWERRDEATAEVTARHRLAYGRLLEENAELRAMVVDVRRRLEQERRTADAMRAKLRMVERILPGPVRELARRIARRNAGQDPHAG